MVAEKIIFLDIDGVLCTHKTHMAFHLSKDDNPLKMDKLDPFGIMVLQELCYHDNWKIVISSTWRLNAGCRESIFKQGIYEDMLHKDWRTDTEDRTGYRNRRITKWLREHPENQLYMILDDECHHMLEDPHLNDEYIIQTEGMSGITFNNILDINDLAIKFRSIENGVRNSKKI
jgi:hypothetical protein